MINSFCLYPSPSQVQMGYNCSGTEVSQLVSHSASVLGHDASWDIHRYETIQWHTDVVQDLFAVLCSSARGSFKKKYKCLLITTKINISVISIRISEDHYGSILRIEIGALLAREKFTSSMNKHSRFTSSSRVVLVTWPYHSDNRRVPPSFFL